MINAIARALSPRARNDRGDVILTVMTMIIIVGLFSAFAVSMAWGISTQSKRNQRNSLAQEAVDVALAQAMYSLNQDYGTITCTVSGTTCTDADEDAYLRGLPDENSRATANLDEFNATKETVFHEVDNGRYGIQAQATWWVDVFDVTFDETNGGDYTRAAKANRIGDLYVEAKVVNPDGVVYGTRSIKVPLNRLQARAVTESDDGTSLSYIVSPLSLFQYAAFGMDAIIDTSVDATAPAVRAWTPLASSGTITLANPTGSFDLTSQATQRYDANLIFFGTNGCRDGNTADTDTCDTARTSTVGFEIQPDTSIIANMSDLCTNSPTVEDFDTRTAGNPTLYTSGSVTCVHDFIMDKDVRLITSGSNNQTVKVFVTGNLEITNGAKFTGGNAGSDLISTATDPNTPQIALFTDASTVTLETDGRSKMYVYAPYATCTPGENTTNTRSLQFYGSLVCRNVDLSWTYQVANHTPFAELGRFTSANGFGSDPYPNNIWYINTQSIEYVGRVD